MATNVGNLRQQSALCGADRPVIIVSKDPAIRKLGLKVVRVYPDTTDAEGNFNSSFKIEVEVDE